MTIQQILIKYWGFSKFRPLQEEVIESILKGFDTLALMPTGGGKSICFQVPSMAQQGICLVISPLVALMKDQISTLHKKSIPALYITSAMSPREIDITLDNAAYGPYKFLYISPERIQTDLFQERFKKMNVNLIAIDEAHCISQWGYDFRPSYLQIARLRELNPEIPFLALTASATSNVITDIQHKLNFHKSSNVLKKSFERKNLAYIVLYEENKLKRLLKIIQSVKGSGIVYVRNRKKTKDITQFLLNNNVSSDYYHAGLDHKKRSEKQEAWSKNISQVMVSTNAFGMGIDKPDVRFVVHMDIPDSIESYFQEAGRAGRDEKKSFCVLLCNTSDKIEMEKRLKMAYPKIDDIKRVYTALGNYFQLAIGIGKDQTFDFEISEFCRKYHFKSIPEVYNSIRFLEKEGYIITSEAVFSPSKIHFKTSKEELYRFQVKNERYDQFIKLMLRSYSGLFDNYTKINETELAQRSNISVNDIKKMLKRFHELNIISYIPQNNKPKVTFLSARLEDKNVVISTKVYKERRKIDEEKMHQVLSYINSSKQCRSEKLLQHFDESDTTRCGICDVCLERNKLELSDLEFESISQLIEKKLQNQPLNEEELISQVEVANKEKVIKVLQWLIDNSMLRKNEIGQLIVTEL